MQRDINRIRGLLIPVCTSELELWGFDGQWNNNCESLTFRFIPVFITDIYLQCMCSYVLCVGGGCNLGKPHGDRFM